MHRVELKEFEVYVDGKFVPAFLMHRVELKATFGLKAISQSLAGGS